MATGAGAAVAQAASKPAASPSASRQEVSLQEAKNQAMNIHAVNGEDAHWQPVFRLPCELAVELPLPNFKVGDFLKLRAGSVIDTKWRVTHDVPLRVNGTLIGWGEFDASGNRLTVRLTDLA